MDVAADTEILFALKCCRKTLPLDAGWMATETVSRLNLNGAGETVSALLEHFLERAAEINGTRAVALAAWPARETVPFLTIYPVLDLADFGQIRDAFRDAPSQIGGAYDQLLVEIWAHRRTFRAELTFINTRGEVLKDVAHEVQHRLELDNPSNGMGFDAVEPPFVTIGEIAE